MKQVGPILSFLAFYCGGRHPINGIHHRGNKRQSLRLKDVLMYYFFPTILIACQSSVFVQNVWFVAKSWCLSWSRYIQRGRVGPPPFPGNGSYWLFLLIQHFGSGREYLRVFALFNLMSPTWIYLYDIYKLLFVDWNRRPSRVCGF